jgi:hypothetical protein
VSDIGIYQSWQNEQQTSARSVQTMLAVPMARTEDAVSPETEAAEAAELRAQGLPVPVLAEPAEGEEILRQVQIKLPYRLAVLAPAEGIGPVDDESWRYLGFTVPTSYQGPEQLSLRSLALTLDLATTEQLKGQAPQHDRPVAVLLQPLSAGTKQVTDHGTVGVDLGQLAACFAPVIARALKLEAHLDLRTVRYDPAIQTSGLQRPECQWTVTDPGAARGFHPAVVAQSRVGDQLCVVARLHVEVRRQMLGIIHKTYGMSAIPFCYVHDPAAHTLEGHELHPQGTLGPLGQTHVLRANLTKSAPKLSAADAAALAVLEVAYKPADGVAPAAPPGAWLPDQSSDSQVHQSHWVAGAQGSQSAEDSDKVSIEHKDASLVSNDPAVRLRKLKELLDEGLVTQAEYDAKRAEIINSI